MRKLTIFALVIGIATTFVAYADIQSPPGSRYNFLRKLGRAFSNVLYGASEFPSTMIRVNSQDGNYAAFGHGTVSGVYRSCVRIGYGLYELVTFPLPTHKGTYNPPFQSKDIDPNHGYSEFPPSIDGDD